MVAWEKPRVYAVKHMDEDVRAASRSGGVFTALTDQTLADGGVVYGCVLTEDYQAVHIRADNAEDRDKMRGSKYIQSQMQDMLRAVKADLDADRKVLFSGTLCQVAGLKSFLGREYPNLCCVDIVCHGVPSPKVWQSYLQWSEKKYKSTCVGADFRNKRDYGWKDHVETLMMEDGSGKIRQIDSRVFTTIFYSHIILRPSCYKCPYKSYIHPGDITIADYWMVDKAAPGFNDNKGVSLVCVNNDKGLQYFQTVEKALHCIETKVEDSFKPSMLNVFPAPENREQFWKDYSQNVFGVVAKKYGGDGFQNQMQKKIRRLKDKIKGKLRSI